MWSQIKSLFRNKIFYLSVASLIAAGALLLTVLDFVIMPAYTNYNEGLTVPDITQVSLEEAEQRLSDYGLRFEIAERRSNSAYPADYVIDQMPAAAEIVKPNRKIYLTVNTVANPTVQVPEVVNLSYRNARIQLENYGLKVGTVSYESSRFKNSVLRQSIPPDEEVPKGTLIDLAVSDGLGEKTVEVPNITGLRLSEAQQKLQEVNLRIGEIRFQPSKEAEPNTILSYEPDENEVKEGETLKLIVAERYEAKEELESGAVIDTSNASTPDENEN